MLWQPIGELDQEHAHVVGDRKQQLAQFSPARPAGHEIDFLSLVKPSTSTLMSLRIASRSDARVALVSSMVSCRSAAAMVASSSFKVGEDRRDFTRVGKIRVARGGASACRALSSHRRRRD